MKADKKVIESITVASLAMALAITAATSNGISTVRENETVETQLEENGIAGVAKIMDRYYEEAANELDNLSIEKEEVDLLAASAETVEVSIENEAAASKKETVSQEDAASDKAFASVSDSKSKEAEKWENKLMAKVDNFLYVREKPSKKAKIVGKMYKGDCATIIKEHGSWTKIESGKVKGYVKTEYCVTSKKAYKYAKKHCDTVAKVSIDGLRVRRKPNTDAAIVKAVTAGDKLVVNTKAKKKDGWVAVKVDSGTYYVSIDYVKVGLDTGKAITIEDEIAAWKEAQAKKAAAASNAAASAGSGAAASTSHAPVSASVNDETLLAALIQCEAGGEGSQCMTAVAAVVMNRVRSGNFPNTISGVIYQSGQFGPASSGRLANRLASGVSSSARAAARAALNGSDPTGGAKYFKLASSGHAGVVIGAVVFY